MHHSTTITLVSALQRGRRAWTLAAALLAVVAVSPAAQAENADDHARYDATGICEGCALSGINYQGADLSYDVLAGASLYGASFEGANLSGADLSNTVLTLATLEGADLSGSNLAGADLRRANLDAANLTGANLSGALTDETTICPDSTPGPCLF